MSQPYGQDFIDLLSYAKSMGIEPSPSAGGLNVGAGEPSSHDHKIWEKIRAVEFLSEEEVLEMRHELEMCQMIIQHFDKEFRRMQQNLNQMNKSMQEIARYRLSWMGLPEAASDKEEVKA